MKILKWIEPVFEYTVKLFAAIAAFLLISMMLIVCYSVVMRYFFNSPLGWAIEVTEDMIIYITFLSAAWLLKEGGQISVDIVYDRLNPKAKLLLDIIVSIVGLIICLILTWYSGFSTWDHFARDAVVFGILKFPMGVLLIIIPIGFLLLSCEFARQAYKYMKDRKIRGEREAAEIAKGSL